MSKKGWISTLAFRRFRAKMNDTSKIYWTSNLGFKATEDALIKNENNEYVVDVISPSFDRGMFPLTKDELSEWKQDYLDRLRLHLLIIVSATLESYLKDATFMYLASKGHLIRKNNKKKVLQLDEVGTALGAPILGRSSVPDPLRFLEKLLDMDFEHRIDIWVKAYSKRCEVAHNGGMTLIEEDNQITSIPKFGMMGIGWDELRSCMKAADEIAAMIDYKITRNSSVRSIEAEQLLRILHRNNKLPHRSELWKFLNDNYGVTISKKHKDDIERIFYISGKLSKTGKSAIRKKV